MGVGDFLVLYKIPVEEDLLVRVYGTTGISTLLVRDGTLPQTGYMPIFEPFNVIRLYFRQSGNLLVLVDILKVEPYSYLSLQSYERCMWMYQILFFLYRWIRFYDPNLFELAKRYLTIFPKNPSTFYIRFQLDVLKIMGLFKEEAFGEELSSVVRRLATADTHTLHRIALSKQIRQALGEKINHLLAEHFF